MQFSYAHLIEMVLCSSVELQGLQKGHKCWSNLAGQTATLENIDG